MALIVETVTADTMAELRAARDRAVRADLVELRLDGVQDLDVPGALQGCERPVIVTCRPVWEGGRFDGGEVERLKILSRACALGADYIDVEWRADWRAVRAASAKLVLSHHDFDGFASDLDERARAMRQTGAAIIKIAVAASSLRDCLALKDAVDVDGPRVLIAMGASGQLTRAWPGWFGSCWSYGGSIAPGQLSVDDLVDVYRVRETSSETEPYALFGAPLCHSASPRIHNAAFAQQGRDALYVPLESPDADEALAVAQAIGVRGASVTAPLKRAMFERSQPADELSRDLGAVNTLRNTATGWESRNFDVVGFLAPLDRRSVSVRKRRAIVLGAGGAARAVAWSLKSHGARVEIAARRREQAEELAHAMGVGVTEWPPRAGWDVLVNTTPVGTWPAIEDAPVAQDVLKDARGRIVYDLVYNPRETTLMRWGREAGAEVIGGMEMLIEQAHAQQRWWAEEPRGPRNAR